MSTNNTWIGAQRLNAQLEQRLRSLRVLIGVFSAAYLLFFFATITVLHDPHALRMGAVWLKASYFKMSQIRYGSNVEYRDAQGHRHSFPAAELDRQSDVLAGRDTLLGTLGISAIVALILAGVATYFTRRFLSNYQAQKGTRKRLIRGAEMVPEKDLIGRLKKAGLDSDLHVGDVPLRTGAETQHMFISGASGSGKGNAIKGLLDGVRRRGQRFAVYDKSGEYVRAYYRPERDILLNPFDARMPAWSPWNEIDTHYDCERFAASFIPRQRDAQDSHWVDAPRTVFADLLFELKQRDRVSNQDLVDALFDKSTLLELLHGTPSEQVLDPDAPEQAGSVRSILAPKIRSIRFLPNEGVPFSLRQWVRHDDTDRCVFIATNERQIQSVKPLITAWLDLIISEVLSLSEDRERRLFNVVDELASLDRLNSVETALFEGRKFGLCNVLSVTSIEILKNLYGERVARAMVAMCSTKVAFRCDEPDSADWLARLYCEEDITEERQGITMSDRYDSTSVHEDRKRLPLLLPTEFMNLPDKQAVIKLGGGLPVATINVPYVPRETVSEGFVERPTFVEPLRAKRDKTPPAATNAETRAKTLKTEPLL